MNTRWIIAHIIGQEGENTLKSISIMQSCGFRAFPMYLDEGVEMSDATVLYANRIGSEALEFLMARMSVSLKRCEDRIHGSAAPFTLASTGSSAADDPLSIDLKLPPPKRYYLRFWKSLTFRLLKRDWEKKKFRPIEFQSSNISAPEKIEKMSCNTSTRDDTKTPFFAFYF